MKYAASVANALWMARSLPAYRRFVNALSEPQNTQASWLLAQLRDHSRSEVGRAYDFAAIRSVAQFRRQVPLSDYASIESLISRVQQGEPDVLTCGRVSHLAPTSGSTGARKLIPFTPGLQAAFDGAVGAWMVDLVRQRPRLVAGPAYWAISPLSPVDVADAQSSAAIRVGYADDAEYLGGAASWLVRQAMAVPAGIRHVSDTSAFWALTLLALLRQQDLRLVSVWHPTYLDLLVEAAEPVWSQLLDDIASGGCAWSSALGANDRALWLTKPDRQRRDDLRRIGPHQWERWWPQLQVVSCWGEQAAEPGWRALARRLPGVLVQPKGLLATEGVVTIPFRGAHVLAVTSHFFEFLDDAGEVRMAHELELGGRYEVVLTTGGGLWRYRLGDLVECSGHVSRTPTLRFLGRVGRVSDLRGEKLSEPFVADVLRSLWPENGRPRYAALRPHSSTADAGYELLVSSETADASESELGNRLESALSANPHYALARRLGQLQPARVVSVSPDAEHAALVTQGVRLGDAKPHVILQQPNGAG
ncbi:MAG: GH3 auxin-responsive promoter family protein [Gemmatimonadaceae bacterium]